MKQNDYKKFSQKFTYLNATDGNPLIKAYYAGYTFPTHDFRVYNPCLKFYVFEYIKSGDVIIESNGVKHSAHCGDVYIFKPGTQVEYYSNGTEKIEKIWFNMNGILLDKLFEAYGLDNNVIIAHCDVENEIQRIHTLLQCSNASPDIIASLAIRVHEIIIKISLANKNIDVSFDPGFSIAEQIKSFIEKNIYDKMSLTSLANHFEVTDKYIIRVFKKKYGTSPYSYIINLRISEAKKLLSESDLTVNEIASKLQFSESNYFSKTFRRYVGCSPIEYRKKCKNKL